MFTGQSWMYDLIIIVYVLSILFYFIDFLNSNRQANRVAFWLLAAVWVLQTVYFVGRMWAEDHFPVITLFESLFFYSWILVTSSLVINHIFKVDFFVFFANLIGFTVFALSIFTDKEMPLYVTDQLTSELLVIHISLAFFSYATFSLSFIFSAMYLLENKLLKQKRWNHKLRRLPDLRLLDLYSYRLNMTGVPLLLISVILGAIWAYITEDQIFWLDPKIMMSVIVLFFFSGYLYQRVVAGKHGRSLVYWNIGGFVVMLINIFISDNMSSFHRWF